MLKVSAVGDWQFHKGENKKVPPHYFDESLKVRVGDILVIRANADPRAIGHSCIVGEIASPTLMLSDKTWRLVLKKDIEIDSFGVDEERQISEAHSESDRWHRRQEHLEKALLDSSIPCPRRKALHGFRFDDAPNSWIQGCHGSAIQEGRAFQSWPCGEGILD